MKQKKYNPKIIIISLVLGLIILASIGVYFDKKDVINLIRSKFGGELLKWLN